MTTNTDGRLWLSPEEAADALGIGRTAMFALLRQGRAGTGGVASLVHGRSRRVPVAALREFAASTEADQIGRSFTSAG